jgi:hypothetical protein
VSSVMTMTGCRGRDASREAGFAAARVWKALGAYPSHLPFVSRARRRTQTGEVGRNRRGDGGEDIVMIGDSSLTRMGRGGCLRGEEYPNDCPLVQASRVSTMCCVLRRVDTPSVNAGHQDKSWEWRAMEVRPGRSMVTRGSAWLDTWLLHGELRRAQGEKKGGKRT